MDCYLYAMDSLSWPLTQVIVSAILVINPALTPMQQDDIVAGVAAASCEYEIEAPLLFALLEVESGFRPTAVGDGGYAIGIAQIQYEWWSDRLPPALYSDRSILGSIFAAAWILNYWCGKCKALGTCDRWPTHYNGGYQVRSAGAVKWREKLLKAWQRWERRL